MHMLLIVLGMNWYKAVQYIQEHVVKNNTKKYLHFLLTLWGLLEKKKSRWANPVTIC